jgi:hypothetical protein
MGKMYNSRKRRGKKFKDTTIILILFSNMNHIDAICDV